MEVVTHSKGEEKMVLQEDQQSKCSHSSGPRSSSSSKAKKPKRPPQRGLGVAQLERIRIQEQEKTAAAVAAAGVSSGSSSSAVILPRLPSSANRPSIPILSTSQDPNSFLRISFPVSTPGVSSVIDFLGPAQDNRENSSNGFLPMVWSAMDSSPHEHSLTHRDLLYDPSFSSLVKKTSPTSSSGGNLQIEPPSNQINYAAATTTPSSWPEEEKNVVLMAGMKRPYPFRLDTVVLHPFYASRPTLMNANTPREGSSSSVIQQVQGDHMNIDRQSEKTKNENVFLSLTPSVPTSHSRTVAPPWPELDGNYPVHLETMAEEEDEEEGDALVTSDQPRYYDFIPLGPQASSQGPPRRRREEAPGSLDLNLKL